MQKKRFDSDSDDFAYQKGGLSAKDLPDNLAPKVSFASHHGVA